MKLLKRCTQCRRWWDKDESSQGHYRTPVGSKQFCTGREYEYFVAKPEQLDAMEYSEEIARKVIGYLGYEHSYSPKSEIIIDKYGTHYTWKEVVQFVLQARQELML